MNDDLTPKRYTLDEILEEARKKREETAKKLTGQNPSDVEISDIDIDNILETIKNKDAKTPRATSEFIVQEKEIITDNPEDVKPSIPKKEFNEDAYFANININDNLSLFEKANNAMRKKNARAVLGVTAKNEIEDKADSDKSSLENEDDKLLQELLSKLSESQKAEHLQDSPADAAEIKAMEHKPDAQARQEDKSENELNNKQFYKPDAPDKREDLNHQKESISPKEERTIVIESIFEPSGTSEAQPDSELKGQISLPDFSKVQDDSDWEKELLEKRKKKVSSFVLTGEEEDDPDAISWDDAGQPEIDDYEHPDDAPSIMNAIIKEERRLFARTVLTAITWVALILITFLPFMGINLHELLMPAEPVPALILMHTFLLLLAMIICYPTITVGLGAAIKLRPVGSDSAVATASVGILLQYMIMMIYSQSPINHHFSSVAVLFLLLNSLGKLFMVKRIRRNFEFVSGSEDKLSADIIQDPKLSDQLSRGSTIGDSVIAYPVKAEFLTNFLEISYKDDSFQNTASLLALLSVIGSLAAAVISLIFNKSIVTAFTVLAASLCICVPAASLLSVNLQFYTLTKKLSKHKAMLAGFPAAEDFNDVNTVAIEASDLFDANHVRLHGIKTFSGQRIDQAILEAAAVVCNMGGPIANVFDAVIQNRRDILPQVDTIVYEEGMGVSGWVAGRRVLVGNRRLMQNHSIDVPSNDYEARYLRSNRNIVYLSTSGELSAMFIISYIFSDKISKALKQLDKDGVSILVNTTDPNITAQMLSEGFLIPENSIKVMTAAAGRAFNELKSQPPKKRKAGIAFCGKISGFLKAISGAIRLNVNIQLISILQTICILLGFAVVLFFAFSHDFSQIGVLQILIYQLFWIFAIVAAPMLRRP